MTAQTRQRRKWLPAAVLLAVGALIGAGSLVGVTEAVRLSSTEEFCTSACHSMQWATEAHQRSVHYSNSLGLRASCADCHLPYRSRHPAALEYLELIAHKMRIGVRDTFMEARGAIATRELWEQERPRLSQQVERWFVAGRSTSCQQCHDLKAFGGDYSEMTRMVHAELVDADTVNCIRCHKHVGHVYEKASTAGGADPAPAVERNAGR